MHDNFLNILKRKFHWSKTSFVLLSGFLMILFLIGYVWWPMLEEYLISINPNFPIWQQLDWLLIGIFLFMSILIMLNADLRRDIPIILIGLVGGYIIEAWGTLSGLWTYYTFETPPLWIVPAWPIAALSVIRLKIIAEQVMRKIPDRVFNLAYFPVFGLFYIYLIWFVYPTINEPLTIFSLLVCILVILTVKNKRDALLILWVGTCLGYFLERWGTTRLCWTYYRGGTPPLFTVLAHGMASVAIGWTYNHYQSILGKVPHDGLKNLLSLEKS